MGRLLRAIFHAWERRLASVTTDRVVRPFEWGLDWIPANGVPTAKPAEAIGEWVSRVMGDSDAFYTPPPTTAYALAAALSADGDRLLTFPSALETPHPANNTVYCRLFRAAATHGRSRAAVLVLPQWNADAG